MVTGGYGSDEVFWPLGFGGCAVLEGRTLLCRQGFGSQGQDRGGRYCTYRQNRSLSGWSRFLLPSSFQRADAPILRNGGARHGASSAFTESDRSLG
jgi:hypothetical protein